MNDFKLILASGSPRRKDILNREGLSFQVIKSTCEENTGEREPRNIAADIAEQKAYDVLGMINNEPAIIDGYEPDGYLGVCVLAADTIVVSPDGEIFGKPESEEDAGRMLRALSGRTHFVCTGVAMAFSYMAPDVEDDIIENNTMISSAVITKVNVKTLTDDEIIGYINTGEPMDKAGAYAIQGIFSKFIDSIDGSYDNVVGLPMEEVYDIVRVYSEEEDAVKGLTDLFKRD